MATTHVDSFSNGNGNTTRTFSRPLSVIRDPSVSSTTSVGMPCTLYLLLNVPLRARSANGCHQTQQAQRVKQ